MVYFSSLSRIIKIIEEENLRPMRDWSLRFRYDKDGKLNRHIKKLKSEVRIVLSIISGNNISEMLRG